MVYQGHHGWSNKEKRRKLSGSDTFLMMSCTKVVTAVAAMQLYEKGMWQLSDAVHKFIPSFNKCPGVLLRDSSEVGIGTEPLARPITMRDILTHTSGLSYSIMPVDSFGRPNPLAKLYQDARLESKSSLQEVVDSVAALPLLHQPGSSWNYSMGIDVVGRVVEVLAAMPLDQYFQKHIFEPLDMRSTCFTQRMTNELQERQVQGYVFTGQQPSMKASPAAAQQALKQGALSPGGGLLSSLDDWSRFSRCLCNGGELEGSRILGARTVGFMTRNHLPETCARGPQMVLVNGHPSDDAGYGFGLGGWLAAPSLLRQQCSVHDVCGCVLLCLRLRAHPRCV